MNNAIDIDNNNSDNTNISTDKLADNTIDNNSAFRANNIIYYLTCKWKSLNTCGNKLLPKQAKVTSRYIFAKSIIAIIKEILAS